jgi:salicylate hydroxylase
VHYPVSGGRFINLVAFAPAGDYTVESWTATATVEELRAEFSGWDQRLISLIEAAETPGRWALLDRAPLRQWSYGPVALLGDAAHPMFPFFAQGAAQAIEDAAVLAACLAADRDDTVGALRRYQELRLPRTTRRGPTSTTSPTGRNSEPATRRSPAPTRSPRTPGSTPTNPDLGFKRPRLRARF